MNRARAPHSSVDSSPRPGRAWSRRSRSRRSRSRAAPKLACARRRPARPADAEPPPPRRAARVAPDAAPPPARPRPTFTLVYSSDLRGRITAHEAPLNLPPGVGLMPLAKRDAWAGLGRRATIVDRARVGSGGVVQVDAGDFLPLPTDEPRDEVAPERKDVPRWLDLVLASYRRLGVDAVTLGERELGQPGLDPKRLARKLAAARVPVVLANLVDAKRAAVFPASVLVDAGGAHVGVLGVTELDADADGARSRKAGYTLTPPEAAVRAAAKDLRARGATFVVALVHAAAGRARAAQIVAGAGDVDVAVSASHAPRAPDAARARPAPSTGRGRRGRAPPILAAMAAMLGVGRLDVRARRRAAPPVLDDAVVELDEGRPRAARRGPPLARRAHPAHRHEQDARRRREEARRDQEPRSLRDLGLGQHEGVRLLPSQGRRAVEHDRPRARLRDAHAREARQGSELPRLSRRRLRPDGRLARHVHAPRSVRQRRLRRLPRPERRPRPVGRQEEGHHPPRRPRHLPRLPHARSEHRLLRPRRLDEGAPRPRPRHARRARQPAGELRRDLGGRSGAR